MVKFEGPVSYAEAKERETGLAEELEGEGYVVTQNWYLILWNNRGYFPRILHVKGVWQEWRESNPQPPVLETGALPIELHSYGTYA